MAVKASRLQWLFFLAGAVIVGLGISGPIHEIFHIAAAALAGRDVTAWHWHYVNISPGPTGVVPAWVIRAGPYGETLLWTACFLLIAHWRSPSWLLMLLWGAVNASILLNPIGDDFHRALWKMAKLGPKEIVIGWGIWLVLRISILLPGWIWVTRKIRAARGPLGQARNDLDFHGKSEVTNAHKGTWSSYIISR